jgi:hypothetical protein
MMPRMDPMTQLKCDRGEWGYTATVPSVGGGSGSFSVGPHPSRFAVVVRLVDSHHSAEMSPIGDKNVSNRVLRFACIKTP